MRWCVGIFGGLTAAIIGWSLFVYAFHSNSVIPFFIIWLFFGYWISRTTINAWSRVWFTHGILFLAAPLFTFVSDMSLAFQSNIPQAELNERLVGGYFMGTIMALIFSVVSIPLAIIFLLIAF